MAVLHIGTMTTLAAVPKADCSNDDVAYVWNSSWSRKMIYNSTSTAATDVSNHPYAQRPTDYGAGPGVWIESVGADENQVFNANQIVTGQLTSTNWAATAGSQYDLDLAKFRLGGSNVDAAGSAAGIFMGLDSGLYKAYFGDGSNVYWKFDGVHLTISVDANIGTGVGVIYKGGNRWLYDFNPPYNETTTPDGYNLFLGVLAGNLTIGSTAINSYESSYNVGIGYLNLAGLTTGYRNVGVGDKVLQNCTTGYNNVGIGTYALYGVGDVTGYNNVGIGDLVFYRITSGNNNIGLGDNVFGHLNTGSNNIGVGSYAGFYQNDGSNVLTTPENSIYIGSFIKSGSDPADGEDAIDNEIVIGYNAIGNGAQSVTLGNTSIANFHCQVALTVDSDKRIKRNISPSLVGLSFITALNPITFQPKNPFDYPNNIKPCNYKDRTIKEKDYDGKEIEKLIKADKRPPDNNKTYLGLTAQEVEEVMTTQGIDLELVSTSSRGKKAITYGNLIMPLITAVQELSQRVEALEGA